MLYLRGEGGQPHRRSVAKGVRLSEITSVNGPPGPPVGHYLHFQGR